MTWLRRALGRVLGGSPPPAAPSPPAPPAKPAQPQVIRARYESAETTRADADHWTLADDLSANAANSPEVRATLRRRARLERDNDGYLDATVRQLGQDMIGTGPRWQPTLPTEHAEAAALVVESWKAWYRATNITEKLRLLHEPRSVDGETFGLFATNPKVAHPVKLDLQPLEAEQVATPFFDTVTTPGAVDGIEFDRWKNPVVYHVLRQHPGDNWVFDWEYDRVAAKFVVHWFRPRRPGQARGVCEFKSTLRVGAQTRRYSNAVLLAAEFAASIVGVMTTDLPVGAEESAPTTQEVDEFEMTPGKMLALPAGRDAKPFPAEQPTETYTAFADSKRTEMTRPTLMPKNRVIGSSEKFNFASGRLDHLPYQDKTWDDREQFEIRVLNPLLVAWYAEAALVGLVPESLPPIASWSWTWGWDVFASLSPIDDAGTTEKELALGVTTLADECAARGRDWRQVIDQRAVEAEYAKSKGVTLSWMSVAQVAAPKPAGEEAVTDDA